MPRTFHIASTTDLDPRSDEPVESSERLYHADLGRSPPFSRVATRDEFVDAMTRWSPRVVCACEGLDVRVEMDGVLIVSRRCFNGF